MGKAWQGRAKFSYVSWGVHGVGNTSHMGIALRNMAVACMCTYMHGDGAEGLLQADIRFLELAHGPQITGRWSKIRMVCPRTQELVLS